MTLMGLLKQSRGSSLVEVLTVVSIMGVMATGSMSMMGELQGSFSAVESYKEQQDFTNLVRISLNKPSSDGSCRLFDDAAVRAKPGAASFAPLLADGYDQPGLKLGTKIFNDGDTYGKGLQIQDIRIFGAQSIYGNNAGGGIKSYSAKMGVIFDYVAGAGKKTNLTKTQIFPFVYTVDETADEIVNCSVSSDFTSACGDFGGYWNTGDNSCNFDATMCNQLAPGSWDGTKCSINTPGGVCDNTLTGVSTGQKCCGFTDLGGGDCTCTDARPFDSTCI